MEKRDSLINLTYQKVTTPNSNTYLCQREDIHLEQIFDVGGAIRSIFSTL